MHARIECIHNWRPVDDCIATSGQPSEEDLGAIAAAGYRTVINLALHNDPRYSLADERSSVEQLGMDYVHIPVQFESPTSKDLEAFFRAMDANAHRKVWIHCAANLRVSAFLGIYWVRRGKRSRDDAFQLTRSLWTPNATWAAFIERSLSD